MQTEGDRKYSVTRAQDGTRVYDVTRLQNYLLHHRAIPGIFSLHHFTLMVYCSDSVLFTLYISS